MGDHPQLLEGRSYREVCRLQSDDLAKSLQRDWQDLCLRFLPVVTSGSIWRHSRNSTPDDPDQGWKLHVSATILTAVPVMKAVAPFLYEQGVHFKAIGSLEELSRLNSGLHHGYSQVGKFITVYPHTRSEAQILAQRLHELTRGLSAPTAPFDQRFEPNSCVSFRYGSFVALKIESADGGSVYAMRDPQGNLVPDQRQAHKPTWIPDLFPGPQDIDSIGSPFKNSYRVFAALVQRGKGGVYKAVDLTSRPPRLCVIKEGRQHGETSWDGRDGRWRANNEKKVLKCLSSAGVDVPQVYASFEIENNFYLVTEFVEGMTLQAFLNRRRKRLSSAQVLNYAKRLAELMARIHAAGWAWRDCKPPNLLLTSNGVLRPLDFEGACPINQPDLEQWGTPGYVPPEWHRARNHSPETQDYYALGAIVYLLLTGILPATSKPTPVQKLRRDVPRLLRDIVERLLQADPLKRPAAATVITMLSEGT